MLAVYLSANQEYVESLFCSCAYALVRFGHSKPLVRARKRSCFSIFTAGFTVTNTAWNVLIHSGVTTPNAEMQSQAVVLQQCSGLLALPLHPLLLPTFTSYTVPIKKYPTPWTIFPFIVFINGIAVNIIWLFWGRKKCQKCWSENSCLQIRSIPRHDAATTVLHDGDGVCGDVQCLVFNIAFTQSDRFCLEQAVW